MGVVNAKIEKYYDAIEYYKKSLNIKYQLNDTAGIAGTLANMGNIYFLWGKYKEAFQYQQKALYLYEMIDNQQGIAACMNHLGTIYENWNDFKSALNYYNTALELQKNINDYKGVANTLNNLGNLLNKMNFYEEALVKYEQAIEINTKENNLKGVASSLNNIGTIYTKLGNYNLARKYYSQALSISKQINSDYEITVNLYAIGNNYVNLKNYNKALPFFKKSLQIATENNLRELMSDNYKALSIVYSFLGMYDNAYKNLYNYNLIKDSIFSRDIHRQITEIKTRYETEKKQKEIELLKRNILINQLKADKREQQWQLKLFILLALTIFIVLIVLSTLILLRLNHRRKLIIAEQKALRAQMNPHFIFNAMNSIQSLIVSRNNEAARKYLNRFSKLMRTILENSQKSTVKLNEELNSLMLYLEIEQLRFEHNFKYIINIDEKINCDDINLPPMLIQPLIENAIQHGLLPLDSKDGLLQLNFDLIGGDSLKITIKDNGIGRAKSAEINKKRFNHVSTGMKNIQERILLLKKIYKGKINFKVIDIIDENYNGAGTIVEIILPAITS